jgi:hypothetical protein
MRLISILLLIIIYTSALEAQDYSKLGESIHSHKLYSNKLYYSGIERGRISLGTMHYSGLLYHRGTSTLLGGTYTPTYTTTDYLTMKKLRVGTPTLPILRPWLGKSLYKNLHTRDKKYKFRYYSSPEVKREGEYYQYYSEIFYTGRKNQPFKDKEINPFLRR